MRLIRWRCLTYQHFISDLFCTNGKHFMLSTKSKPLLKYLQSNRQNLLNLTLISHILIFFLHKKSKSYHSQKINYIIRDLFTCNGQILCRLDDGLCRNLVRKRKLKIKNKWRWIKHKPGYRTTRLAISAFDPWFILHQW